MDQNEHELEHELLLEHFQPDTIRISIINSKSMINKEFCKRSHLMIIWCGLVLILIGMLLACIFLTKK